MQVKDSGSLTVLEYPAASFRQHQFLQLKLPPLMASRQDPTPAVSMGTAGATVNRAAVTQRPIESIRVGQRVVGQNPEVTAEKRQVGWVKPAVAG